MWWGGEGQRERCLKYSIAITAAISGVLQHADVMSSISRAMHSHVVRVSEHLKYVSYQYRIFLFWMEIPSILMDLTNTHSNPSFCHSNPHPAMVLSGSLFHFDIWEPLTYVNRQSSPLSLPHCECLSSFLQSVLLHVCVCVFDYGWVLLNIMIQHTRVQYNISPAENLSSVLHFQR